MKRAVQFTLPVLGLLAFLATWVAAAGNDAFPDISIPDLKAAIAENKVTLLDANGTASWREGHIPGALDFQASKGKLSELLPTDKNALIVAYCGGPMCHAYQAAATAARELGYSNIRHLSAGIKGWRQANEKTEPGN